MTKNLQKSARVAVAMIEGLTIAPGFERTPEFRAACEYIRDLEAAHGEGDVWRAIAEVTGFLYGHRERIQ